ncbi:hypothetical protein BKH41_05550 [Helicobacter sp. 12S02232-10]|uniref:YggT family protein n=1 Tax=Helicobacter sp. 12S02232-10 TaxID=1476197 RepID=UPI000BA71AF4|nr:YggT family protein [Helicobacter sp. 12S02232-10]PAF48728.1 hypothetical protein BKH41_05550 [Helicobacter sp. 12S02232-10]
MILGSILSAIATILHTLITLYTWVVIIAALVSWVRPDPYNPIVQVLFKLTDPLYRKLKGKVPLIYGGIDFSPLVVIIILQFLDLTVVKILLVYSEKL